MEGKIDEALGVLKKAGFTVIHQDSLVQKPVIRDLSDVLEKAGYRIDEARIERNENHRTSGRIMLTVFALEKMTLYEW